MDARAAKVLRVMSFVCGVTSVVLLYSVGGWKLVLASVLLIWGNNMMLVRRFPAGGF